MHATMMDFMIWGDLTRPRGPFRAQGRADAQDCKITWLEELASEKNTIQAREDITEPGKIAGPDLRKLCVGFGWFMVHISGLISSFGLALFVVLE